MDSIPSTAESTGDPAKVSPRGIELAATVHPLPSRDAAATERWVAIVDSRPCRRECLAKFLRDQDGLPERVLGMSASELVRDYRGADRSPSLIILSVGGDSLLETAARVQLERLLACFGEAAVVVHSDLDATREARLALSLGAKGFVSTALAPELMCLAFTLVQAGGVFAPPSLVDEWVHFDTPCENDAAEQPEHGPLPQYDALTPRQTHVLHQLQEGHANKVIAAKLDMTESTVKVHVRQIMRKLGAANRTEAALLAQRHQAALRRTAC